mmetsp:Transcript_29183/g.45884  ORF Transcript_29183/g.45884 Transcript_29183/m.45884 type:complete len:82 (-) Transcript_29183:493-738(-)
MLTSHLLERGTYDVLMAPLTLPLHLHSVYNIPEVDVFSKKNSKAAANVVMMSHIRLKQYVLDHTNSSNNQECLGQYQEKQH